MLNTNTNTELWFTEVRYGPDSSHLCLEVSIFRRMAGNGKKIIDMYCCNNTALRSDAIINAGFGQKTFETPSKHGIVYHLIPYPPTLFHTI
jgi:hypothetical protein